MIQQKKLKYNIIGLIIFSTIGVIGAFLRANEVAGSTIILAVASLGAITILIFNMVLIYKAMKQRKQTEDNKNTSDDK